MNAHKVIGISFVLVFCLTGLTGTIISTNFSGNNISRSEKTDSLSISNCNGAPYGWTWISGNNSINKYGVYGTKGTSNTANHPGARVEAASWTDTDGNLWLFGGTGYNESDGKGDLNDLWRFSIASKEWTWISGTKALNEHGVYGMKGVPNIANYPGARYCSISWTDTDGNLWLFGGYGYNETGDYGDLNDLWKFTITSKEWTWISGNETIDQNGIYGKKGAPNIANYPGGRHASISWMDTDGNLWLFGGAGYAESGGFCSLNDLWRFNITSKEWVWMSGNKTTDVNGTYGNKGIPDMANYPGGRAYSISWKDKDGNLWLFGGNGYDESDNFGRLNDLWRFNITTREWAWILGNKTINQNGVYGTKGISNATTYPGSRWRSSSWRDIDGDFWLFGGSGYAKKGGLGWLNDLWRFNITSNEWTWMSGNETTAENGVYGKKGIFNVSIYPGARGRSVSWTDANGNFWLFGGVGYPESGSAGSLNDLWKFGCIEKSQPKGQIPSAGSGDDDDDDDEQAIPFGNFYLLFIVVGIIGGVIFYKKKHSILNDQ